MVFRKVLQFFKITFFLVCLWFFTLNISSRIHLNGKEHCYFSLLLRMTSPFQTSQSVLSETSISKFSERLIYLAYSACSLSSCYHCKSYTVLSLSSPGGLVPRLQLIPKSMHAQVPHVKCCSVCM